MIACEHPKIVINQGVYECVAFTKYIITNGIQRFFYNISKLQVNPLYQYLKKLKSSLSAELLSDYYTFDRFGLKVPLFVEVPCNKCILCLQSFSNSMSQRLQFESEMYDSEPWFVTLTYAPHSLPKTLKVRKSHISMYIKRLREHISREPDLSDVRIKFYGQGEYGEKRGRPHYHLIIFGLPPISFYRAEKLFKSAWQVKWTIFAIENGKSVVKRPLIGRVGISQINSPQYRAYYKRKTGRVLNPEDGLRYCCQYTANGANHCHTWSLGLGKSFVLSYFGDQLRQPNGICQNISFRNKYNKIVPLIVNRWFLHTYFHCFNRSTYYLRNQIYTAILSLSNYLFVNHKQKLWFLAKYKPLFQFVGVNSLPIELFRQLLYDTKIFSDKYRPDERQLTNIVYCYEKLSDLFDRWCVLDIDKLRNETILYNEFCKRYFALKPELTKSMIHDKLIKTKKYQNKHKTLTTL